MDNQDPLRPPSNKRSNEMQIEEYSELPEISHFVSNQKEILQIQQPSDTTTYMLGTEQSLYLCQAMQSYESYDLEWNNNFCLKVCKISQEQLNSSSLKKLKLENQDDKQIWTLEVHIQVRPPKINSYNKSQKVKIGPFKMLLQLDQLVSKNILKVFSTNSQRIIVQIDQKFSTQRLGYSEQYIIPLNEQYKATLFYAQEQLFSNCEEWNFNKYIKEYPSGGGDVQNVQENLILQQVDSFEDLQKSYNKSCELNYKISFDIQNVMLVYSYFFPKRPETVGSFIFMDKKGRMMPVLLKFSTREQEALERLKNNEYSFRFAGYPTDNYQYIYLYQQSMQKYFFTDKIPFAKPGNFGTLKGVRLDDKQQLYIMSLKERARGDGVFQTIDQKVYDQQLFYAQKSWLQGNYETFHQFSFKLHPPSEQLQQKGEVVQKMEEEKPRKKNKDKQINLYKFIGYFHFLRPLVSGQTVPIDKYNKYFKELNIGSQIQNVIKYLKKQALRTDIPVDSQKILINDKVFHSYGQQFDVWRINIDKQIVQQDAITDITDNLLLSGITTLEFFNIVDGSLIQIENLYTKDQQQRESQKKIGFDFLPLVVCQLFDPTPYFTNMQTNQIHRIDDKSINDFLFFQILNRVNPFAYSLRLLKEVLQYFQHKEENKKKIPIEEIVFSKFQLQAAFSREHIGLKAVNKIINERTIYKKPIFGISDKNFKNVQGVNKYSVQGLLGQKYGMDPSSVSQVSFIYQGPVGCQISYPEQMLTELKKRSDLTALKAASTQVQLVQPVNNQQQQQPINDQPQQQQSINDQQPQQPQPIPKDQANGFVLLKPLYNSKFLLLDGLKAQQLKNNQ